MKLISIINKIKKEGGKGDLNIKNKKIILFSLILLGSSAFAYELSIQQRAGGVLQGALSRPERGSNYWSTSNLREWLNSSQQNVSYTNNPPTDENTNGKGYADEAGFLYEFTDYEKEQIAVTNHRVVVGPNDWVIKEGGDTPIPHLNVATPVFLANYEQVAFDYQKYYYKSDLDKVFLLNPYEMYWYLNRRGFEYTTELTTYTQSIYDGNKVKLRHWVQSAFEHTGEEQVGTTMAEKYKDVVFYVNTPLDQRGVVPAIHLKPGTRLSDGRLASDLSIGDKLIFGRYKNEAIEWRVINITKDGYPLLMSTKILDFKIYDAKGDYSQAESDYINWANADVSILEDIQYRSTNNHPDTEIPYLEIQNIDELYERKSSGYTLQFKAFDEGGSGIKTIELPNGQIITNTEFEYTFDKNDSYIFRLTDHAGNVNDYLVAVSNINLPPHVVVQADNEEWTNQNVTVDINSSIDIYQDIRSFAMGVGGSSLGDGDFPNYGSYAGAQFRVTGTLTIEKALPGAERQKVQIGMHYISASSAKYTQKLGHNWNIVDGIEIPISSFLSEGRLDFDFIFTVPTNYFENLKPYIALPRVGTIDDVVNVRVTNWRYELISDSNFGIQNIQLPNGTTVNASSYSHIISEEGIKEWEYKVIDNTGKETPYTITTKIDKTKPTIQVKEGFIDSFSQGKEYLIQASDVLSGIESIEYELSGANQQPLRSVNGSTASIVLKNSGATTLKVRATDRAGNTTEMIQTITVDPFNPCLSNYDGNRFIISDRLAQLELEAIDQHSGIVARQYKANDEAWSPWIPYDGSLIYWDVELMREGLNTFFAKVKDGAGNISDPQEAEIVYDPVGPTITDAEVTPYYTNQSSVQVHVVAEDNYEPEGWTYTTCIQLSNDGTNWTTYSTQTGELTVKDWTIPLVEGEQVLYVRGIDNSLNIGPVQEVPYVVDLTAPTGSIIINDDEDFVQEETATLHLRFEDILNGIPDLSGVAQIELFNVNGTIRKTFTDWDWTTHQKDYEWTLEFYEKTNKREYAQVGMIITDRAGNETVIYSKEVELAKLMIKDFHLTNVVNPSVYNKNNPFQLLTYPNFPPQPLLLGASFSYQLDYECLIELKDNWTFEYDLVVLYEKPDGSIVENKETVQAPIRGLSLPLGSFNHDHLLPNEGLPTSTQVYFGTTFRILDENGDLIASDTYPKDSSINGTFVPSNMILIGEIKGHIKDLIRFNEFN